MLQMHFQSFNPCFIQKMTNDVVAGVHNANFALKNYNKRNRNV